jgi:hypothetical protein
MRHDSPLGRALGPTYPLDARILRDVQPYERPTGPVPTRSATILQTLHVNKHYETRDEQTT